MTTTETFLQENTFKTILKEYVDLNEKAKEAGNAANRKKTELSNALNALLVCNDLPVGTAIQVDDKVYKYATTESAIITYEDWHKAYKAGNLTENQFIEGLSVSKTLASRYLGEDVVRRIEVKITGNKAEIGRASCRERVLNLV